MASKLTFIIPVFRPKLDTLHKSIQALGNQSLVEWDAVFVLDGPDDVAYKAIEAGMKKLTQPYEIWTQKHRGAPAARNFGFSKSEAPVVVFWDYDCQIEVDAARLWLMELEENKDLAFVYSSYRFLGEQGAIESEPFDPWRLTVQNYISTCFPVRREYVVKWNESLKSLQDWDFWYRVVHEKKGKGKYLAGYHFATPLPDPASISGIGCKDENWLGRVDAVKKANKIPYRDVCVSSPGHRQEGIWLAKLIDADYMDIPNYKPNRYKTIVQLGFGFIPGRIETHMHIFKQENVKKVILYTCDDVTEIISRINLSAIWKYTELFKKMGVKQYVEDQAAYDTLTRAGFDVEILPLPLEVKDPPPMPEKPVFGLDMHDNYKHVFDFLSISLPDVEIKPIAKAQKIGDISGFIHFHPDRTLSGGMKRALLAGRPVISNVRAKHVKFVDDKLELKTFMEDLVNKIRITSLEGPLPQKARDHYVKQSSPKRFMNAIS